jgi:hypothetical protein
MNLITSYSGQFYKKIPNGFGVLEFNTGDKYVGLAKDGIFNSIGIIYRVNGEILVGNLSEVNFWNGVRIQKRFKPLLITGLTMTSLTEELKKEGIARDLVNRIQNLRKDMGLQVQAKISVLIEKGAGELVEGAVIDFGSYISTEVQAIKIEFADSLKDPILLDLDDYKVHVVVKEETL